MEYLGLGGTQHTAEAVRDLGVLYIEVHSCSHLGIKLFRALDYQMHGRKGQGMNLRVWAGMQLTSVLHYDQELEISPMLMVLEKSMWPLCGA